MSIPCNPSLRAYCCYLSSSYEKIDPSLVSGSVMGVIVVVGTGVGAGAGAAAAESLVVNDSDSSSWKS